MVAEPKAPTWAQRFRDAVWEAGPEELTPTETLVLLSYADHAHGGDTAWVVQSRLIQRCKIRSKGTPKQIIDRLVEKGWLELLAPAQWRSKQTATYRLLIPTAPSDGAVDDSKPPRSKRKPPRSDDEPPRSGTQTAPPDGANRPASRGPLSSERPSGLSGEGDAPRAPEARGASPEDQEPPALPPGEGRQAALAIAQRSKRRDVIISHWRQPPPAEPNPKYNPARAAAAAMSLPVFDFPQAADEDSEP